MGLEVKTRLQVRGGVSTEASSKNEVLLERELFVETDTLKMKVGDGVSNYNDLGYIGGVQSQETTLPNVGDIFRGGFVYYVDTTTRLVKTMLFSNDSAREFKTLGDFGIQLGDDNAAYKLMRAANKEVKITEYSFPGTWRMMSIEDLILMANINFNGVFILASNVWSNTSAGAICSCSPASLTELYALEFDGDSGDVTLVTKYISDDCLVAFGRDFIL